MLLPSSFLREADRPKEWRTAVSLFCAASAATAVFFARAAFSSEVFFFRDVQRVYYPLKEFWAQRVRSGAFPEWYPYDGLGQSFVGMVVSGAFHPSNLSYLILSPESALKLNTLLCFPVAFTGAWLLARRFGAALAPALLTGTVYAYAGYPVSMTANPLYLMAAATLPWAMWAADRAARAPSWTTVGITGGILASILYAGDAQTFTLACVLGFAVVLARSTRPVAHRVLVGAGVVATAGALAAAQILPALLATKGSQARSWTLDEALMWSSHPLRLLEVAVGPLFRGSPDWVTRSILSDLLGESNSTLWAESVHVGLVPLALAVAGIAWSRGADRRLWVAAGALALVLVLGKHAGLYATLLEYARPWRAFRYPEKTFPFFLLALAVLAGIGLTQASQDARRRARIIAWLAASAGTGALLALLEREWRLSARVASAIASSELYPDVLDRLGEHVASGLLLTAGACGAAASMLALVVSARKACWLVAGVVFLHLLAANQSIYRVTLPMMVTRAPEFIELIREREGGVRLGNFRVFGAEAPVAVPKLAGLSVEDGFAAAGSTQLTPVTAARFGLEGANAYLPAAPRRLKELIHDARFWGRYLGMLNVRYLAMPRDAFLRLGGRPEMVLAEQRAMGLVLLHNPRALPRAYLATQRCVADEAAAREQMGAAAFSPDKEAVVVCQPKDAPGHASAAPLGSATVRRYEPEDMEIEVNAAAPALAVVVDAHAPGWRAWLDGEPAELLVANLVVRGVRVPKGRHRLRMEYRTPGLRSGLALSGAALLLVVIGATRHIWAPGVTKFVGPRKPSGPPPRLVA